MVDGGHAKFQGSGGTVFDGGGAGDGVCVVEDGEFGRYICRRKSVAELDTKLKANCDEKLAFFHNCDNSFHNSYFTYNG